MKEDLLHFIWQQGLFNHHDLLTTLDEKLEIIKPGNHNNDAGPDFNDARVKIGNTLWAGHIELHVKSSEWKEHKHHLDPAYKNVILHVVYLDDTGKENPDNSLPVLELNDKIDLSLIRKYEEMMKNRLWIPCQENLPVVREITKKLFIERLVIERLEYRYNAIIGVVQKNNYDWHESFHQCIARSFGFNVNSEAFEELASRASLRMLAKHRNDVFQLESILFGEAGMLNGEFTDEYPRLLQKEYDFLKKKYSLNPMNATVWKFARLRPGNFPTIRISQYACLVHQSENLYSRLLEARNIDELYDLLSSRASSYWMDHYIFDKISTHKSLKKLGKESIDIVVTNTVVPFIFVYGKEKQRRDYIEKALKLMEQMSPEKNNILNKWENLGFTNSNASDSQALLHLKKNYCNPKRCLNCTIGNEIFKKIS